LPHHEAAVRAIEGRPSLGGRAFSVELSQKMRVWVLSRTICLILRNVRIICFPVISRSQELLKPFWFGGKPTAVYTQFQTRPASTVKVAFIFKADPHIHFDNQLSFHNAYAVSITQI
jgi:hypothetical protein